MRMLDLFCGRFGWSRAFAARGWECIGVDLTEPPEVPKGCRFVKYDILKLRFWNNPVPHFTSYGVEPNPLWETTHFDFICASSPCEEFSVHGMKHFHPNPKYPENGIRLFNHTREICEASGVPYVMENVRAAQQFVGQAVHHCGPFYLWGTGVPPLMNQGISKKGSFRAMPGNIMARVMKAGEDIKAKRQEYQHGQELKALHPRRHELQVGGGNHLWSHVEARKLATASAATIPPELANCVCDYAKRICEPVRRV